MPVTGSGSPSSADFQHVVVAVAVRIGRRAEAAPVFLVGQLAGSRQTCDAENSTLRVIIMRSCYSDARGRRLGRYNLIIVSLMQSVKIDRLLKAGICLLAGVLSSTIYAGIHERVDRCGRSARRISPSPPITAAPFRLPNFGGKLLVLNFWATWCPPCVEETPSLNQFAQQYAAKGVVVLGVSVDKDEKAYRRFPPEIPSGVSDGARYASCTPISAPSCIPETYLIDAKGRCCASTPRRRTGPIPEIAKLRRFRCCDTRPFRSSLPAVGSGRGGHLVFSLAERKPLNGGAAQPRGGARLAALRLEALRPGPARWSATRCIIPPTTWRWMARTASPCCCTWRRRPRPPAPSFPSRC